MQTPMLYLINFKNQGSKNELISQVHTTDSYENLANFLKTEVGENKKTLLALGSNTWPLTWFLYGQKGYFYNENITNIDQMDYLLVDLPDEDYQYKLNQTHTRELIALRWWWWPKFDSLTFKNLLQYTFLKKPWNVSGEKYVVYYKKKTIL